MFCEKPHTPLSRVLLKNVGGKGDPERGSEGRGEASFRMFPWPWAPCHGVVLRCSVAHWIIGGAVYAPNTELLLDCLTGCWLVAGPSP